MLFRIAINVTNDLRRSEQSRRVGSQCSIDGMDLSSDQPGPDRELAANQDLERLYQVIAELPPKCQQVFLLSRAQLLIDELGAGGERGVRSRLLETLDQQRQKEHREDREQEHRDDDLDQAEAGVRAEPLEDALVCHDDRAPLSYRAGEAGRWDAAEATPHLVDPPRIRCSCQRRPRSTQ